MSRRVQTHGANHWQPRAPHQPEFMRIHKHGRLVPMERPSLLERIVSLFRRR